MHRRGFTLIELSIVLVIIALIVGGVLTGRELIRVAQNRAYVAQITEYNAAVVAFRGKYNCLPGDCANGTSFFPTTANGNGNNIISTLGDYGDALDNITNGANYLSICLMAGQGAYGIVGSEPLNFWDQLRLAGTINGPFAPYTAVDDPNYTHDLPKSRNDAGGIVVAGWNGRNYFRAGITHFYNGAGAGCGALGGMSPADAAYIYYKLDGGPMTVDGNFPPPGIVNGERIIPTAGVDRATIFRGSIDFFVPPSQGAGGANANVCINTSISPPFFNVANPNKICDLIIRTVF